MKAYFLRPQSTRLRKILFQVHLWVGVGVGLYLLFIGITGALVVFRQDFQAAAYPQFFHPDRRGGEPNADPSVVLRNLRAAYPEYSLSGIDFPTYRRDTFLAYVARGREFKTVFAHPVSGQVSGELPFDWIRTLQELHFNLMGGPPGLVLNGIGSALMLVMCLTGLMIWWPGPSRWLQALRVDLRKGWKRISWELHGASGAWIWVLLVMWAVTGIYFAFSQPFRSVVNAVAPLTVMRAPESDPVRAGRQPAPVPEDLLARAQRAVPDAAIARFVLPFGPRGSFLVVMAREVHGDYDTSDEMLLYFDQYTGELLEMRDNGARTAGDSIMAWLGPLHVGSFGGLPVKILWAVAALALPLLFITGFIMWWNRVVSERWSRRTTSVAGDRKRNLGLTGRVVR